MLNINKIAILSKCCQWQQTTLCHNAHYQTFNNVVSCQNISVLTTDNIQKKESGAYDVSERIIPIEQPNK